MCLLRLYFCRPATLMSCTVKTNPLLKELSSYLESNGHPNPLSSAAEASNVFIPLNPNSTMDTCIHHFSYNILIIVLSFQVQSNYSSQLCFPNDFNAVREPNRIFMLPSLLAKLQVSDMSLFNSLYMYKCLNVGF